MLGAGAGDGGRSWNRGGAGQQRSWDKPRCVFFYVYVHVCVCVCVRRTQASHPFAGFLLLRTASHRRPTTTVVQAASCTLRRAMHRYLVL